MDLSDWLDANKLTRAEFAEKASVHPVTVSKWITRKMQPRPHHFEAISRVTGGDVTANDFIGPRVLKADEAAEPVMGQ